MHGIAAHSKTEAAMEKPEIVRKAEMLVGATMAGRDASHDAAHVCRVRDLALSLSKDEALSASSLEIGYLDVVLAHNERIYGGAVKVELAALLHDIGDYKYTKDLTEDTTTVEKFLEKEGLEESKREKILAIIRQMGFKNEVSYGPCTDLSLELCIVQDADRLDAIGAIGIARCFVYGGSKNHVMYDPEIPPRQDLSKEKYMMKDGQQTTVNHFHEKLFKLKDLMKTKAGKRRAERRHKFMEDFLAEFHEEWNGRA